MRLCRDYSFAAEDAEDSEERSGATPFNVGLVIRVRFLCVFFCPICDLYG